jgi:hypothetical protein
MDRSTLRPLNSCHAEQIRIPAPPSGSECGTADANLGRPTPILVRTQIVTDHVFVIATLVDQTGTLL